MAIVPSLSFQDEAKIEAMGQAGDGEGAEVFHHDLHQILRLPPPPLQTPLPTPTPPLLHHLCRRRPITPPPFPRRRPPAPPLLLRSPRRPPSASPLFHLPVVVVAAPSPLPSPPPSPSSVPPAVLHPPLHLPMSRRVGSSPLRPPRCLTPSCRLSSARRPASPFLRRHLTPTMNRSGHRRELAMAVVEDALLLRDPDLCHHARDGRRPSNRVGPPAVKIFSWRCATWWVPLAVLWGPQLQHDWIQAKISVAIHIQKSPTHDYLWLLLFISFYALLFFSASVVGCTSRDSSFNYPTFSSFATKSSRRQPHGSKSKTSATAAIGGGSFPTSQHSVLSSSAPTRQLLLWYWMDESASTWVFGKSFLYLRRRLQPYPSAVGMFLLQRLNRPSLNRRYARSVHPGACVFDASAYTPHWQNCSTPRSSRRCCLSFWSQDLNVIRSSLQDLYYVT